eukprot:TRINITY_DN1146_c0_g1_i1.p2 TRINITY_DN1146_c0_g1~~TRINITY_DN1146_c0_g1_i1.p2  ORF type:complete len:101 (+),score=21.99 TRINITY_DN1146_c0_g1_i1:448-750(+)
MVICPLIYFSLLRYRYEEDVASKTSCFFGGLLLGLYLYGTVAQVTALIEKEVYSSCPSIQQVSIVVNVISAVLLLVLSLVGMLWCHQNTSLKNAQPTPMQ